MTVPHTELERMQVRQEFITRVAVIIGLLFMLGFSVVMVTLIVSIHHSSDVILDCTTVGGHCYERGQKQTQDAVKTLEQIVVASNVCSSRPGVTFTQVQICVSHYLALQAPQ